MIPSEDRICGNCVHWDVGHMALVPVRDQDGNVVEYTKAAPCLKDAVEPDAGRAFVFFGRDGNCQCHADAFESCLEYLDEIALGLEQWAKAAAC